MILRNRVFWAFVFSLIFGVALHWPLWLRGVVVVLGAALLIQLFQKLKKPPRQE